MASVTTKTLQIRVREGKSKSYEHKKTRKLESLHFSFEGRRLSSEVTERFWDKLRAGCEGCTIVAPIKYLVLLDL